MAKALGIDLIIADHHLPGPVLPDAYAILNPKKPGCPYPYKELSGCGIAFKLACALNLKVAVLRADPFQYIDLVALSIASDIVPITGENRILAHFGLEKLNANPLPGIAQLKETAGYERQYDIADVVFKLGPRINAAGRLAHAHSAVELLIGGAPLVIGKLAEGVNDLNDHRKELERDMVAEALEIMAHDAFQAHSLCTVAYAPHWHKGVVGIVAAKLVEQVYKPTVVLTNGDDGLLVGSARTVDGFDLYDALSECRDLFKKFGGHQAAAGLSLPREHLELFKHRFDQAVRNRLSTDMLVPKVWYDMEMGIGHLGWTLLKNIERMGPFGPMNMRPVFVGRGIPVINLSVMSGNHMRFQVRTPQGGIIDAVAFNLAAHYEALCAQPVADLCYTLEWRQWRDNRYLQLNIKDIKLLQS
jgi:single-stranded-DNA-specific exonuclease